MLTFIKPTCTNVTFLMLPHIHNSWYPLKLNPNTLKGCRFFTGWVPQEANSQIGVWRVYERLLLEPACGRKGRKKNWTTQRKMLWCDVVSVMARVYSLGSSGVEMDSPSEFSQLGQSTRTFIPPGRSQNTLLSEWDLILGKFTRANRKRLPFYSTAGRCRG